MVGYGQQTTVEFTYKGVTIYLPQDIFDSLNNLIIAVENQLQEVVVYTKNKPTNANYTLEMQNQEIEIIKAQYETIIKGLMEKAMIEYLMRLQNNSSGGELNTVTVINNTTTWYMDNDGDGYHSNSQSRATCPGSGWCNTTTKGLDCDDNKYDLTNNCSGELPIIGWFLDMDGDGWHATAQGARTSPGPEWTSVMTKGLDCNDNLYSLDNSVCSVTPPPCTNKTICDKGYNMVNCECVKDTLDSCEQLALQNNNPDYKAKVVELQAKTGDTAESGYIQSSNASGGGFTKLTNNSDHSLNTSNNFSNARGFIHNHLDNFKKDQNGDGILDEIEPIRMFSSKDIKQMHILTQNAYYRYKIPFEELYVGMISSTGNYTMKFEGTIQDMIDNGINYDTLNKEKIEWEYLRYMGKGKNPNLELNVLRFMKEVLNLKGITLYKIDAAGEAVKLTLDATGKIVVITPC